MKTTFDLQNPWKNQAYIFPQEEYIERDIFGVLCNELTRKEITVLVGSRQVGKTFLMKKLIEKFIAEGSVDRQQIFYFNFDAFILIDLIRNENNFLEFLNQYGLRGKPAYIFLDEAQRIPEAGLVLKKYYDLDLPLKFFVSGSSSLQIKSQVKETLTGRKRLFELYPLTYKEFLLHKGLAAPDDITGIQKFESDRYQRLFEEFVVFGGYPGVVKVPDAEEKTRLLKEIYASYIQKDISDFLKIEDVPGFNRLVHIAASQCGGLCKIDELAKNARLSRHFVEKYLFALGETYITAFLRPHFANLGRAIIKTPKLYFLDTGIRNAVFGMFEQLNRRHDAGMLVENFVFTELMKNLDKDRLWFYRTATGSEIDFLHVSGDRVVPVEVKYGLSRQKVVPKPFGTLLQKAQLQKAFVITMDFAGSGEKEGLDVTFMPARSAYALHHAIV